MPFRSPLFRKLLLDAFLPTAVTLVIVNFYLARYVAFRQVSTVEKRLGAQAAILQGELATVPSRGLQAWVAEAARRSGADVSLYSADGAPLADSIAQHSAAAAAPEDEEVTQALRHGSGSAIRYSPRLGSNLCAVAVRVENGGASPYVLRLAVPLRPINAEVGALRWRMVWASLVAAIVALIMATSFSRSFTRRITQLRTFAENLTSSPAASNVFDWGDDELGELARSLNITAGQLRGLVDRLRQESARREAILASMVEGVLAVDHNLNVTFCNESLARLVGRRTPVPASLPLLELVRDTSLKEMLQSVVANGEPQRRNMALPVAEGRTFEVQAASLREAGLHGAIAILHDITELERLERIRKDFVANVSHELRTPLTAIRGYAEALLDGALDDKENRAQFTGIILSHAVRLNNICSDLLTLSALESGRGRAEAERISLRSAADSALEACRTDAVSRQVELQRGNMEECQVLGARMRLEQALINLVDNAIKFNRPGGRVRVEVARCLPGMVMLTVADNGIGIPSEDLTRIFERFYRVDRARSRQVGGTGLGLSIVKHVIERMGGTIKAESQLGKGSTFTITLPEQPPDTLTEGAAGSAA